MLALLIADVVAIAMALTGFGVWALVAQLLLLLARTVILWVRSSWGLIIVLACRSLKSFFGFSYKLLLSNLCLPRVNNIYQA